MTDSLPGFNQTRLLKLMRAAMDRCRLDLSGTVVLTEAATGAYVATPILAALAGARRVSALARPSRHGSVEEIAVRTMGLARLAGVHERIRIVTEKDAADVAQADVVTNSGHVRPIDAEMVGWMKRSAVIPLMYEAWEFRAQDVDLEACSRHGIRVAGTNERHPAVDVFSYLGIMANKLLLDAGIAVYGCKVMLCCDNPFASYIHQGLIQAGASVEGADELAKAAPADDCDVLLVAMQPRVDPYHRSQRGGADPRAVARGGGGPVLGGYRPPCSDRSRSSVLATRDAGARPHGNPACRGRSGAHGAAAGWRTQGRRDSPPCEGSASTGRSVLFERAGRFE